MLTPPNASEQHRDDKDADRAGVIHQRPRSPVPIVRIDPRPMPGQTVADLGPLLDTDQAAQRISRSRSWVYQAWARGDFVRPIYLGREARFPQRWVDEWIEAQVKAQIEADQSRSEA